MLYGDLFVTTLLCLNLGKGGFRLPVLGKKNPQVHLIVIREWPNNTLPTYFKKSG